MLKLHCCANQSNIIAVLSVGFIDNNFMITDDILFKNVKYDMFTTKSSHEVFLSTLFFFKQKQFLNKM